VRGMKLWSFAQVRFSLTLKMFRKPQTAVPKKSGSAHNEIYLERGALPGKGT